MSSFNELEKFTDQEIKQSNDLTIVRNKIKIFTMTIYKYFCNGDFTSELDIDIQEQLESIYQSTLDILVAISSRQTTVPADTVNEDTFETAIDYTLAPEEIANLRDRISRISNRSDGQQGSGLISPVLAALGNLLSAAEQLSQ